MYIYIKFTIKIADFNEINCIIYGTKLFKLYLLTIKINYYYNNINNVMYTH